MTVYFVEVWDSLNFPVYPVAFAIESDYAQACETCDELEAGYIAKGGHATHTKVETVYNWKG